MDKNAIKKYAVWAREELIKRVSVRATKYGIISDDITDAGADAINGKLLTIAEKKQREDLITQIKSKGYEQVMEEVAYTWFNRFCALRFMEVNNYLPTHIRVFTDELNNYKPQIMTEAIHLELDGIDKTRVLELKEKDANDELYKYLITTQCNALSSILPQMFPKISDYTELLFPDNILREGSVIQQMIALIPEDDFCVTALDEAGNLNGQVEILGWLYQSYISTPKDVLINAKKQYKKNEIPFVTQIFTSDWIVKYMVDNSLGRYWIERNPNSLLKEKLEFLVTPKSGAFDYIEEKVRPESITFFDPCMGSGHILVYAFDVFMEIYKECGYSERDAVQYIIENNLFGADIDERAYQYAYFAIKMKARSYYRGFLNNRNIEPNLVVIQESNKIKSATFEGITIEKEQNKIGEYLVQVYLNAKEIGTLSTIEDKDYSGFMGYLDKCSEQGQVTLDGDRWTKNELPQLKELAKQATMMKSKYTVVCTNPPYLPNKKMPKELKAYIEDNYSNYKSDTFSAFIVRCLEYSKYNAYVGMLTPLVWMFISSHEKLRAYILGNSNISSLVQLEYNAFEAACVPVCCFVLEKNSKIDMGNYIRLVDFKGSDIQGEKTLEAIKSINCDYLYEISKKEFSRIPTSPISYWASKHMIDSFNSGKKVDEFAYPKQGLATADNNRFLRLWFEVCDNTSCLNSTSREIAQSSRKKWFPYNKGGGYKKWYGNNEYMINWENDGSELRNFKGSVLRSPQYYFRKGASWCKITSSAFSMRYIPSGFLFDVAGCTLFLDDENFNYVLGYMNSITNLKLLSLISPTLNFEVGHVGSLPIIFDDSKKMYIDRLVQENVAITKQDWDSFEVSWDFLRNPLLNGDCIKTAFEDWKYKCDNSFNTLKSNEEELNRTFIDIYGLSDELVPEAEDKDITLKTNTAYRYKQKKKKLQESEFEPDEEIVEAMEIRDKKFLHDTVCEFISYAVGCIFGRYSLDTDGLAYAGGKWDDTKYITYIPDKDNIITIDADKDLEDDITSRFIDFVKIVYSNNTIENNLCFIADALGGKGEPKEIIRNYFLNNFFNDHCNMYTSRGAGKRPIYWLFDSGKKNGFKALIYMHRYQPDLLARIRTDYIHMQQARYRTEIEAIENQINSETSVNKVKLSKKLNSLRDQLTEITIYEEKIHHLADQMTKIDLDDGVTHNYEIFKDVLAKIK